MLGKTKDALKTVLVGAASGAAEGAVAGAAEAGSNLTGIGESVEEKSKASELKTAPEPSESKK
jgi:hypothetical protein